jgi:hypothetical protein
MQVGLRQSLVNPRLVRAERAAALQKQSNPLEWRPLGYDVRFPVQRRDA